MRSANETRQLLAGPGRPDNRECRRGPHRADNRLGHRVGRERAELIESAAPCARAGRERENRVAVDHQVDG